jgi:hypothetical protein
VSGLDPVAFVLSALEREGALIERSAGHSPNDRASSFGDFAAPRSAALALLPADLATRLGIEEECRLGSEDGATSIGFGSPVLERLIDEARSGAPIARATLDVSSPRGSQARSLAGQFRARNAVCDLVELLPGSAVYVASMIAYVVQSDDRHEGMLRIAACVTDGSCPDDSFAALLDPLDSRVLLGAPPRSLEQPPALAELSAIIARRAQALAREKARPFLASAAKRQARDSQRIIEYFDELIRETRSPRRKLDRAAIDAKVEHLVGERDAKLRDLVHRYALSVRLLPAAFVLAEAPVITAVVRVRRRKAERELRLRLPARAAAFDRLACDGCRAATARPALCDGQLHILCESCAPNAQGRLKCAACERG